jgi:hypothetical protein
MWARNKLAKEGEHPLARWVLNPMWVSSEFHVGNEHQFPCGFPACAMAKHTLEWSIPWQCSDTCARLLLVCNTAWHTVIPNFCCRYIGIHIPLSTEQLVLIPQEVFACCGPLLMDVRLCRQVLETPTGRLSGWSRPVMNSGVGSGRDGFITLANHAHSWNSYVYQTLLSARHEWLFWWWMQVNL